MTEPGLLLVRGLGHSGSTLLDLVLGGHPSVVGLGEASRVLFDASADEFSDYRLKDWSLKYNIPCTCGATVDQCFVWSRFFSGLNDVKGMPFENRFSRLMFPLLSESTKWIVESYQSDELLLDFRRSGRAVRVIHLVRDARSWVHSEARRGASRYGRGRSAGWRALLRWMRVNRHWEERLRRSSLSCFRLGYEELALAPEASLKLLCNWLGLDFCSDMLRPRNSSTSHIIAGNRMRHKPGGRDLIKYDGAWLASNDLAVKSAGLVPGVSSLNRRLVYSNNVLGEVWPHGF